MFDADSILVEPIDKAEIDKRLSWQTGGLTFDVQKKLSKRIPSRASRSRLGDLISELPAQPRGSSQP